MYLFGFAVTWFASLIFLHLRTIHSANVYVTKYRYRHKVFHDSCLFCRVLFAQLCCFFVCIQFGRPLSQVLLLSTALGRLNFLKLLSNMQQHLGKKNLNVHVLHESLSKGCCLKQVGEGQVSMSIRCHSSKGSTSLMVLRWEQPIACQMSRKELLGIFTVRKLDSIVWWQDMAGWHIHGGCDFFLGGEILMENAKWFGNLVSWLSWLFLNAYLRGNSETEAILGSFE